MMQYCYLMKAIGYCRVSTIDQGLEGVSLDNQKARIDAWALANDHELLDVFVDTASGAKAANRTGLQNAVNLACKSKGILVVYSLSRLARSVADTLVIAQRLERSKADLASLSEKIDTSSAVGKMVFRLLSTLNEFERDQIAERTKSAMAYMRRNNRRISRYIPYGYDLGINRILTINKEELNGLNRINQLRAAGLSFNKIAIVLTTEGYKPKNGNRWYATTIRQLLLRQEKFVKHI